MASDSGKRMAAAGTDWHEDRLIDVRIYINKDESEGCSATFGYGLTLEERRRLVEQALRLLADMPVRDLPPPPR
jgi:hypothetical protein